MVCVSTNLVWYNLVYEAQFVICCSSPHEQIETTHNAEGSIFYVILAVELLFSWTIKKRPHVLSFLQKAVLNVEIGQNMSEGDKRSLQPEDQSSKSFLASIFL